MINPEHKLPLTKQARALGISRGSIDYLPRPVSDRDQALMKRIDKLHLESPFAGARMLRDMLRQEGFKVGRTHVRTLMQKMGIEALYCKPRTTKRNPEHRVYPYLLRSLPITRANQVWAMDITYCAPSLRKLLWKMLSGLEHVWNASRTTLEETNWMPALCYGRA